MLVIVYYQRIVAALEAFIQAAEAEQPESQGTTVTVATPEQASGLNADASVFLCAHRRMSDEKDWYSGHADHLSRRYVGLTRAGGDLYLFKEGPKNGIAWPSTSGDKFWMNVAKELGKPQPTQFVEVSELLRSQLKWEDGNAAQLLVLSKKIYNGVQWRLVEETYLRSRKSRPDQRSFFTNAEAMQKERVVLDWDHHRDVPKMPLGTIRCLKLDGNLIDIDASREIVQRWKAVMVPSWTVLVTGPETAHLDFNFVARWLHDPTTGQTGQSSQHDFDEFITSFCTLVAHEDSRETGKQYQRRIDFHKLEEELALEKFTVFFRHCWSTRRCTKILGLDQSRYMLYGYNGMGLHRGHPDWWSMVIRSRSLDLTARVCGFFRNPSMLECPFSIVNAIPGGPSATFNAVRTRLHDGDGHRDKMDPAGDEVEVVDVEGSSCVSSDSREDDGDCSCNST